MQQQGSHCKRLPEAQDTLFPARWDWTLGPVLFGKRNREQGISASLLPHDDVNAVSPAARIYVDGAKCSALIDYGCSRTIIDADRCRSWRRAIVDVMTIGGMSRPCCGDGMVFVSMEEGSSAKISVLVVRGKQPGFDQLLGIDAIKALLVPEDQCNSATRKLSSVPPFHRFHRNFQPSQLSTIGAGPGLWYGSSQRGAYLRH